MKTTSISKLKSSLSLFLDIIKNGEEVIITDRGKAFAKIIPLDKTDIGTPLYLLELERTGLAHLGSGKVPEDFLNIPKPKVKGNMAIKAVLEERETE
jgi:prevent-host-death family protein